MPETAIHGSPGLLISAHVCQDSSFGIYYRGSQVPMRSKPWFCEDFGIDGQTFGVTPTTVFLRCDHLGTSRVGCKKDTASWYSHFTKSSGARDKSCKSAVALYPRSIFFKAVRFCGLQGFAETLVQILASRVSRPVYVGTYLGCFEMYEKNT